MTSNAAASVDRGALQAIFNPDVKTQANIANPVLQCVQLKPLSAQQGGGPERFRVVFSDINNFVQSMLATQANHVVHDGKLQRGCFVRLKSFQQNNVKDKKILIILDLEVLEHLGIQDKLGSPVALDSPNEDPKDTKAQSTTMSTNGFYGNKISGAPQSRPANTASTVHGNIYPIEALSPYANKWTIKARCTQKSDIKTWHNKNGEGKLFSVNLLDDSGEIRGTGFNDQCDALYDIFQEGGVYYLSSPCRVNMAKKQFSNLNNDYELMFERDTRVEKAEEASDGFAQVRYNFTTISQLEHVEKDSTIDLIAVLTEVAETSQIESKKTSKPYSKRDLTLVDRTGYSVRLTIWGNTAEAFDANIESVIAFKGLKLSYFGGRTLSLLSSGTMAIDPDIEDAHKLKGWYLGQGKADTFQTHSHLTDTLNAIGGTKYEPKTVMQVREEQLGMNDEPDLFSLKATIVYIRNEKVSNFAYPSCLSVDCKKKLREEEPGQWRCEKCSITHPKPEYKYVMSVGVADHTGQLWLSCFDEMGRVIMGTSADHVVELREQDERNGGNGYFTGAVYGTWMFRVRAKMEMYQDKQQVRFQVTNAAPLDYSGECKKLTEMIKKYEIQ